MSNRLERKERAEARADRAATNAADAQHKVDSHIARQIPLGQPILVGHHSEGRHRRTLASFDRTIRGSIDADEQAKAADYRARNSGYAIQVGDDDATTALREKIERREVTHGQFITHNKETKKGTHVIDTKACPGCKELNHPRIGYHPTQTLPAYVLNNSRGRIKQAKQQLVKAEKVAARKTAAAQTDQSAQKIATGDGWDICNDIEDDRVRIYFDGKPPADRRAICKNYGFRWAPNVTAWQRQNTANGLFAAKQVAAALTQEASK